MKAFSYIEVIGIRLLTVLIQLLFIKCVTNAISVNELGIYYFLLTISYTLNAVLFVPLDYFQQSTLYKYIKEEISIKSYFVFNKRLLVPIFVLIIVGSVSIGCFDLYYSVVFIATMLMSIGTYASLFLRGFVNNLEHRRRAAYNLFLEGILRILFLYLLFGVFEATPLTVLFAFILASYVTNVLLLIFIIKLPEYRLGKTINVKIVDVFRFSYPISIGAIANWIQLQSYRLVLVPFGYSEAVGFYATVANVGTSGMNVCSTIYNQLFIPDLYKTKGRFLGKYISYALGIILVVLLVTLFLKNILVELLTNSNYMRYSYLIFYGIIVEAGNFIVGAFTSFLGIHNMTKYSLKVSLVGAFSFIFIFLFVLFTNNITPHTVGIPIVLSQLIVMGYLGVIVYKIYNIQRNEL